MERSMTARPYTPEEKKVVDYIVKTTDGAVGGGEDPVGFILASHVVLALERAGWKRAFEQLKTAVRVNGAQDDFTVIHLDELCAKILDENGLP